MRVEASLVFHLDDCLLRFDKREIVRSVSFNIVGLLIIIREDGVGTIDLAGCPGVGKKRTTRSLLAIERNNQLWDNCTSVEK